jgi:hypothetical protein
MGRRHGSRLPIQKDNDMKYRAQIKMVNCRQIDIESDGPLTRTEVEQQAIEKVRREYGGAEYMEMESFEVESLSEREIIEMIATRQQAIQTVIDGEKAKKVVV